MLGESLLVAPVFSHDGVVTYYLPAGRWTNFLTGRVVEGPGWMRETHDALSLPLMVRPHSVIAVGNQEERPDYDYGAGVTLQVYELEEGQPVETVVPTVAGDVDMTLTVVREGRTITAVRRGSAKGWRLALIGGARIASVMGGTEVESSLGVLVEASHDTDCLRITLA
jgi:alpha-D-xyloside xylohydrolase